jgi:hypothetical protein
MKLKAETVDQAEQPSTRPAQGFPALASANNIHGNPIKSSFSDFLHLHQCSIRPPTLRPKVSDRYG